MKKSRIVIPALAMIAFSMAASITGAVAWFTATRTAQIDAGTYAVVKTSSNLSVTLGNGIGTTASDENGVHEITVGAKLTDGSFDHAGADNNIYAPDETGTKIGKITPLDDADTTELSRGQTNDSTPVPIYTAATFDITFTVAFGSASGNIGLFLDCAQDTVNNNPVSRSRFEVSGGNAADTATGFRMAFVATNGGETKVFAGLQTSTNCHFVNSGSVGDALPTGNAMGSYNGDLIDSQYHTALTDTFADVATAQARTDYFGTFTYAANSTASLTYTVVCWFEGTDPNVTEHNNMVLQSVITHLQFRAINLPAA